LFGFFLLEHPKVCGMLGHDFSCYLSYKRSKEYKRLEDVINRRTENDYQSNGAKNARTYLSFGQSRKYIEFRKKMEVTSSTMDDILDDDPSIAYRKPTNTKESLSLLRLKSMNPALAESMVFQTDSVLHAASAYILQEPVILLSSGLLEVDHKHVRIFELEDEFKGVEKSIDCNSQMIISPHWRFYDSVVELLKSYKNSVLSTNEVNSRAGYCKFVLNSDELVMSVSIIDVVKRKWFNDVDTRGNSYMHKMVWEHHKLSHKWLRETAEETLKESPFSNHWSLRNYLFSLSASKKSIQSYCPSRITSSTIDTCKMMIVNCQRKKIVP
jgi:hypothetical protein